MEDNTKRAVEVVDVPNPGRAAILERGRAAYREKLTEERRAISDPLLGEFFVHPMTMREQARIHETYEKSKLAALVRMIVVRVRDASGARIFQAPDEAVLLDEWNAEDIQRIAGKIQADRQDEATKAIEAGESVLPGN